MLFLFLGLCSNLLLLIIRVALFVFTFLILVFFFILISFFDLLLQSSLGLFVHEIDEEEDEDALDRLDHKEVVDLKQLKFEVRGSTREF